MTASMPPCSVLLHHGAGVGGHLVNREDLRHPCDQRRGRQRLPLSAYRDRLRGQDESPSRCRTSPAWATFSIASGLLSGPRDQSDRQLRKYHRQRQRRAGLELTGALQHCGDRYHTAASTGSATLFWTDPSHNTDGTRSLTLPVSAFTTAPHPPASTTWCRSRRHRDQLHGRESRPPAPGTSERPPTTPWEPKAVCQRSAARRSSSADALGAVRTGPLTDRPKRHLRT